MDFVPLAEPAFPPPSLYGAPEVTTEAPVQIVNRTFGYICEFTVFEELCVIDVECDVFGNELTNNTRWDSNLFPDPQQSPFAPHIAQLRLLLLAIWVGVWWLYAESVCIKLFSSQAAQLSIYFHCLSVLILVLHLRTS